MIPLTDGAGNVISDVIVNDDGTILARFAPPRRPDPTRVIDNAGRDVTPKEYVINSRGELVWLDTPEARAVAKAYGVPDALVGIPTPWWRRVLQRFTRQP